MQIPDYLVPEITRWKLMCRGIPTVTKTSGGSFHTNLGLISDSVWHMSVASLPLF